MKDCLFKVLFFYRAAVTKKSIDIFARTVYSVYIQNELGEANKIKRGVNSVKCGMKRGERIGHID